MGWLKNLAMKILNIQPVTNEKTIIIKEPLSYEGNLIKNRIWYRGDANELDQFFKQSYNQYDQVSRSRFWASVPSQGLNIRKIHSGLPAIIADKISDITVSDLTNIDFDDENYKNIWNEISLENKFRELLHDSVIDTLVDGDGVFKQSIDTSISEFPIIEFFSGDEVEYNYQKGRLFEIVFNIVYYKDNKQYILKETYGKGYITYKLLNSNNKEVNLSVLDETKNLYNITFTGDFIMATPLKFFKSPKFENRGKSIFDNKSENFDALDETISQWMDAIRSGRVKQYIPEELLPRDPKDGSIILESNPYDNNFIKLNSVMNENKQGMIDVVQPDIKYEAFSSTYSSNIDMCLQGILSPATLGIDLKKDDNADAQREKEKITLYTRQKVIDILVVVIPDIINKSLKIYENLYNQPIKEHTSNATFGEYSSPGFDTVVETVGKGKTYGVMSVEQCVEEMYGETKDEQWKREEVARLKAEQGIITVNEPSVKQDTGTGGE